LLTGTVSLLGTFTWIFQVPGFRFYHALPLAIFYGAFTAIWCAGISWFNNRKKTYLVILFAPALWVALEFFQNHLGFLSFSWATLARSQHATPAILQMAALTGEYGITFLIVLVNVIFVEIILRRNWKEALIAGAFIGLCLLIGSHRLNHPVQTRQIRVAVVQPSILLSERKTPESRTLARRRMEQLTYQAASFHPALIVWPETALRDLKRHPELIAWIRGIARKTHAALIVGASEFTKFGKAQQPNRSKIVFRMREYNTAWFFNSRGQTSPPYRKRLLVPFGEYLPLTSVISWPDWLVPKAIQSLPGNAYRVFSLGDGIPLTPIICWENLFPDFVRKAVKDRAWIVVQLVNDNWFGKTAAPEQHNMASVLRAVENRVPVIVASNTGPSEIIGPYGQVLAKAPRLFLPCVITAEIPVPQERTFYTKYGNLFSWFCIFGGILLIPLSKKKRR